MNENFKVRYRPGKLIVQIGDMSYPISDSFLKELIREQKAVKLSWKKKDDRMVVNKHFADHLLGYDEK